MSVENYTAECEHGSNWKNVWIEKCEDLHKEAKVEEKSERCRGMKMVEVSKGSDRDSGKNGKL